MEQKNNFARVLEWLKDNGKIKTQKELAKRMKTTQATITRNKQGNVQQADDDTIRKFAAVFGDIINIAYLRGESDVMLVADLHPHEKINTGVNSVEPDYSSLINATIAAKDETIMSLKHEIMAKDETIAVLRAQLEDKSDMIKLLKEQVKDLRAELSNQKGVWSGSSQWGVADNPAGSRDRV